jgi:pentatricopeptide repeat protein
LVENPTQTIGGSGTIPAGHAYTTAIHVYCKIKDVTAAESTFEQMRGPNIRPDSAACTALLSAYAATGAYAKVEELIRTTHVWPLGSVSLRSSSFVALSSRPRTMTADLPSALQRYSLAERDRRRHIGIPR